MASIWRGRYVSIVKRAQSKNEKIKVENLVRGNQSLSWYRNNCIPAFATAKYVALAFYTRYMYGCLYWNGGGQRRVDGGGCWDFQYARDLRAENTVLPNARTIFESVANLWRMSMIADTLTREGIAPDDTSCPTCHRECANSNRDVRLKFERGYDGNVEVRLPRRDSVC